MSALQPRERVMYAGSCQGTPPLERFAAIAAAGFTATTLFTNDLVAARGAGLSNADLRAAIERAGLILANLEIVGNWIPGQRADTPMLPRTMADNLLLGTAEKVCAHAVELGAHGVTVADLFGVPFDGAFVARHFARLCDVAADHGLAVTLEFVPAGCVATVAQAREVIERAGRDNAGILIDSWHFHRGESRLKDIAALPPELIAAWQMNDFTLAPAAADMFSDMMIRSMPGEGEYDFAALMRAIAATGTTAPGGIEVFSIELAALPFAELASRAAQGLDYCLQQAEATP